MADFVGLFYSLVGLVELGSDVGVLLFDGVECVLELGYLILCLGVIVFFPSEGVLCFVEGFF